MRGAGIAAALAVAAVALACGGGPSITAPDAGPPGARLFDQSLVHQVELDVDARTLAALGVGGAIDARVSVDGADLGVTRLERAPGEPLPSRPEKIWLRAPALAVDGLDGLWLDADVRLAHIPAAFELWRRAGLVAPRAAHAVVRARGVTLGFYTLVEAPGPGLFVRALGDAHAGAGARLFIGPWDFGDDPAAATLHAGSDDRTGLAALAAVVTGAADADFAAAAAALLDLDGYVTAFAVESLLVCADGYTAARDRYGLYQDPADGRFRFLPLPVSDFYRGDPVTIPPITVLGLLGARVVAIPALDAAYRAELARIAPLIEAPPRLDDTIVAQLALLQAASAGDAALADDVARAFQAAILLREGLDQAAAFGQ